MTSEASVLDHAYGACRARARAHYENFPVASRLVPARLRPHIAAVYAFARLADDFADEPVDAPPGASTDARRLALLDACERRLERARPTPVSEPGIDEEVFAALRATIREFGLPVELFRDLLSAFRQDVTVGRYADRHALLDYCRRSANPIGRIVLRIFGHDDPALDARADAICTALQLTNFWQDVAADWRRGRVYIPQADLVARGCDESAIGAGRLTPALAAVLEDEIRWTRDLFARGRDLGDLVGGRLKWELRATWCGGVRILDRIESAGCDVFARRRSLGWRDAGPLASGVLLWRLRAS